MIYLLTSILLIELILSYHLNGKRIISPSIVAVGIFLLSSFVYALNLKSYYGKDISFFTVLVISLLLLFIILGELLATRPSLASNKKAIGKDNNYSLVHINNNFLLFFTFFTLFSSLWYVYDIYKFSLLLGNSPGNLLSVTFYIRQATNFGTGLVTYSSNAILSQSLLVSKAIIYLCLYCLINNSLIKRKVQLQYLFPILPYFLYVFFCDSRGYLILDAIVLVVFVSNVFSKIGVPIRKQNKIFLIIGILVVAVFLVAFRLLGFRTGTSYHFSLIDNIVDYISSGIYGLDLSLNEGLSPNIYLAEGIMRNIYIKLNDFGFDFQMGASNGAFFKFLAGQSNIYTGLLTPVKDFGIFSPVFVFAWSFICQRIAINKTYRLNLLHCYLLSMSLYPLAMISIGGEWANVLSITTVYQIVYLFLIEKLFTKTIKFTFYKRNAISGLQNNTNWR